MPRRPGALGRPCDWVEDFPAGAARPDAPAGATELAFVAAALRRHLDAGHTVSGIARASGVDRTTIQDLLAGRIWIDTHTLARLERAVGARLWPHEPDSMS